MTFIIAFEKNKSCGGFGDRVVGIISCILIAKLLKRNIYIKWAKENIKQYINYSKYDYDLAKLYNSDINTETHNCIDWTKSIKEYLINGTNLFPAEYNKFYVNQEISRYLYKNKLYSNNNYYKDIFDCYNILYTDILIPTEKIMLKINNLIKAKNNIIGIQVRLSDYNIINKRVECDNNINTKQYQLDYDKKHYGENINESVLNILKKIKEKCDKDIKSYSIFITSSYEHTYNLSLSVWDKEDILYNNDIIYHLDSENQSSDISKIFIDNYILSAKTSYMYISDHSNYGRIAALSCTHDNIYNLHLIKLNKKDLLRKHN
jgi:hypothetical protein